MASTAVNEGDTNMEDVSPTNKAPSPTEGDMRRRLDQIAVGFGPLEPRADPDAQATVTDFLDFTEYLPSDVIRSLTLIGKLDQRYIESSHKVHELTAIWGRLPSIPAEERPDPVELRAEISRHLKRAVNARRFAYAEAVRMHENVSRHYKKAKVLYAKLKSMYENYPREGEKSPIASQSPQTVRSKPPARAGGESGPKIRRQRPIEIIIPGEVRAPHEVVPDISTDDSDYSSDEDSDAMPANRRTPGPAPRIKLVSNKSQKSTPRPRQSQHSDPAMMAAIAANTEALLHPPPENAVIGSPDAPWLQLTQYELAKLRKRMKKNAQWTPSETMIARELKALGRGPEAYREAKKKAEEDGKAFEPTVPKPVAVDDADGVEQLPAGAISADSVAADEIPTLNRGMKLNEAKKIKREALAKQAAEEAEASERQLADVAKLLLHRDNQSATNTNASKAEASKDAGTRSTKSRATSRSAAKRKREQDPETSTEGPKEGNETPSSTQAAKRPKTQTPVLPPARPPFSRSKMSTPEILAPTPPPPLSTPGGTAATSHPETPVPIPIPPQSFKVVASRAATSPVPSIPSTHTVTPPAPPAPPVKLPHQETPVPLPIPEQRKSVTPVLPPVRETPAREMTTTVVATTKRETRGEAAKRSQQQQLPTPAQPQQPQQTVAPEPVIKQSSSRGPTPRTTPAPEIQSSRRPGSRGKAMSQEPMPSSLAADRPRRASTARNTPAPEARQPSKRTKRPAPGVVSTTNSGGNSAVGKRKAAPKKKARTRKDKGQPSEPEMEEVDDEGNPIDPDEPRYCLCNRVSFGTMIQCDNVDNCKQEWFHLECVGLSDIPARTTKWYCPDCRVLLNIGERGEVSARGVRK